MPDDKPAPPPPPPADKKPAAKQERLAKALRENLQRRKAAAPRDER